MDRGIGYNIASFFKKYIAFIGDPSRSSFAFRPSSTKEKRSALGSLSDDSPVNRALR